MVTPQQVVLATGNAGKRVELAALLDDLPLVLVTQSSLGVCEAEEIGLTFVENAIIKARNACAHTGLPALADDSGLEVSALGGRPGVRSARFASQTATDQQNVAHLLKQMTGMTDRRATFRCVIVYLRHAEDPVPVICEGSWAGEIAAQPGGDDGFGYDPVFYLPALGCTAAQLTRDHKNTLSHRAAAMALLRPALQALYRG